MRSQGGRIRDTLGDAAGDAAGAPRLLALALLLVMLCALPALLLAQPAAGDTADYRLQARELAPGVFVVEGANADFAPANGCNIINTGFIATGAGVIVVDTGPSRRYGEQLRALIARTTREPVIRVVNLNLHPDHFLGNQAFADVPRTATPGTREGMQRESAAYETNLYRLCGAWMKDTAALLPDADAAPGIERIGTREIETIELQGHTASDLVLVVHGQQEGAARTPDVVFAGGLVFARRAPTTPHARPAVWIAALQTLAARRPGITVPSHGPVAMADAARDGPIAATTRYIAWMDRSFRDAARRGLEMNEVLRLPVPAEFRGWAAFEAEYVRSVAHLYPSYEQQVLAPAR